MFFNEVNNVNVGGNWGGIDFLSLKESASVRHLVFRITSRRYLIFKQNIRILLSKSRKKRFFDYFTDFCYMTYTITDPPFTLRVVPIK